MSDAPLPPFEVTPAHAKALKELLEGKTHLFITGKAGTGKSTLLSHYRTLKDQPVVVLAPTGVAALNVLGQTIHSVFHFSPNVTLEEAKDGAKKHKKKALFSSLDEIVIDEISMVRADLIDCMDVFLREIRKDSRPFGGVRLIMFGDMYQLPPIVGRVEQADFNSVYRTPFFFGAQVFQTLFETDVSNLTMVELEHIFRQTDDEFVQVLNAIRTRTVTPLQLAHINKQVGAKILPSAIVLTGRRDTAKMLNDEHLESLPGASKVYKGHISGKFPEGNLPTEKELELRVGARVMFVANDKSKRWVNGTLGTVLKLSKESVTVKLDNGKKFEVDDYEWEMSQMRFDELTNKLERDPLGSFTQLPLIVAHAITIHKSQGKTFDHIVVNLERGAFAHGQTYVALSRARTLEGVSLTVPVTLSHVMMDRSVSTFLTGFKRATTVQPEFVEEF